MGELVDQGVVFAPAGVGNLAAGPVECLADGVAAEFDIGENAGLRQRGEIGGGLRDG